MNRHSKKHLSGILLMLQAAVAFSIMALCVKIAAFTLPSTEIVFFRSVMGVVMISALMLQKKVSFFGTHKKLLFFRGLSGFLALLTFFHAMARLPLGTAVILNYTAPIFSALLAIIILKERPRPLIIVMILAAFVGVFFLIGGADFTLTGPLFIGLASAVFAACAYVTIRALKHRESPLTIIFYFTGISTVASLAFLTDQFQWPNAVEWLLLCGVGIGSFYGQLWMTIALRRAPASLVSPFSYLTPLLTFSYGLFLWNERLTWLSCVGVVLIIGAGCVISIFGTKKHDASLEA